MNKSIFLLVSIFLSSLLGFGQQQDVELTSVQEGNKIKVTATNHSKIQQEITVTATIENLKGYDGPITKLLPADKSTEIAVLEMVPNKQVAFSASYTFIPKPTDAEIALQDQLLKEKTVKSLEDMKEGIVLFYQDGCPRCSYVTTYMLNNDIGFKLIDTTSDEKSQILMWDLLRLEKPELKNVTMPVVLVNGQISYDIENLKRFSRDFLKPFSGI